MPPSFFVLCAGLIVCFFIFRGVTRGVIEENFSKFLGTEIIKKYRKTLVLSGFTVFFGGDNRDRTGDLLNAIQNENGLNTSFFSYKGVTGV